jgi:hypothetical protein
VVINRLAVPASAMHVAGATGINDKGEIAAQGILPTGEVHGILLVPVKK